MPASEPDDPNLPDTVQGVAPLDPWIGRALKKYAIVAQLGKGGMGVVYLAEDQVLKRAVAIKMIANALTSESKGVQRFLREAQSAARLQHANVVALYDIDQDQGAYYLVMEFVPGPSAEQLIDRDGALPRRVAVQIAADACRGLGAAHGSQMIHRDVKPANLLVARTGEVKLGDFGLAKVLSEEQASLTQGKYLNGTPQYMSPEQAKNEDLDERSDLYSLGATFYALLTGEPPFPGKDWYATLYAHATQPTPDPRRKNADIPEACVKIVERAMAKRRGDRYADAEQMLTDLQKVLGPRREKLGTLAKQFDVPTPPASTASFTPKLVRSGVRLFRLWLAAGALVVALSFVGVSVLVCGGVAIWYLANRPPSAQQFKRQMMARNPEFNGEFKTLQERGGRIVKVVLIADDIIDVEPIGALADLEELELLQSVDKKSNLKDLKALGRLSKLTRLHVSGCAVEDFEFVRQLKSLTRVYLGGTLVSDLTVFRGLPLIELRVGGTRVASLDGLQDLPLETLELNNCYRLKSLDGVPTKNLRWLGLCATLVPTLEPIKEAKNLEYLDFHWAKVTSSQRPDELEEQPVRSLDPETMAVVRGFTNLREVHGEFTAAETAALKLGMKPPKTVRVTPTPPPAKK